jgi:hypothetical protein
MTSTIYRVPEVRSYNGYSIVKPTEMSLDKSLRRQALSNFIFARCSEKTEGKQGSASLIRCRNDTMKTGVPHEALLLTAHACSEECLARRSSPRRPQAAGIEEAPSELYRRQKTITYAFHVTPEILPKTEGSELNGSGADELAANIQP